MASTSTNMSDCICDLCGVGCRSQDDWNDHNKLVHEKKENEYTCNICDYTSSDWSNLASHIRDMHCLDTYDCVICNIKKVLPKYAYIHHQEKHRFRDKYICRTCEQSFDYFSLLIMHYTEAHCDYIIVNGQKRFKYNDCEDNTLRKHDQKRLKLSTHLETYNCEICDISYVSKDNYQEHQQNEHKSFLRLNWFICHVCKGHLKSFLFLIQHYERVHIFAAQFAPWTCNVCQVVCATQRKLNEHMHIHKEEHPFQCIFCGYRYRCRSTLDTHIHQKHPEQSSSFL